MFHTPISENDTVTFSQGLFSRVGKIRHREMSLVGDSRSE